MPDYPAIAELFARYGAANDLHSRELLASTLTEGASVTIHIAGADSIGPLEGRDTVVSFFGDILDSQTDQRRHVITNFRRLEGDRVNAYLTLIVTDARRDGRQERGDLRGHGGRGGRRAEAELVRALARPGASETTMLALSLVTPSMKDPLGAVEIAERAAPEPPDGWTTVDLRASSLNHHDVWNMRGVGVDPSWLPVVMGSDGAGVDADGNEVIVYPLIADPDAGGGDETLDPRRRMISDGIDGTFAQRIAVPRRNVVPKPAALSWESAACLGTAWLTAYRMLFGRGDLPAGSTILVQGAGGGLSTALIALGRAGGLRVWVTSRSEDKRGRAVDELGADAAFEDGARLPGTRRRRHGLRRSGHVQALAARAATRAGCW